MSYAVDDEVRADLEEGSGSKLTESDWCSVRQCVRCLVRGQQIVGKEVVPSTASLADSPLAMSSREAVRRILRASREHKVSVLEAARLLTFKK